jgi:hypothetical protein
MASKSTVSLRLGVENDARDRAEALFAATRPYADAPRETKEAPAKARKAHRGPIFLKDGRRVARAALWT